MHGIGQRWPSSWVYLQIDNGNAHRRKLLSLHVAAFHVLALVGCTPMGLEMEFGTVSPWPGRYGRPIVYDAFWD
jgi:hypothetical protein